MSNHHEKLPSMCQCADQDHFWDKVLTTVWDIPPGLIPPKGRITRFLLKWHCDYLRDKTHLEISKDNKFVPYIYRDEVKYYILSYDRSQLEDSKFFWLSFRKSSHQLHGYVLIKKARDTTNG